MSVAAVANKEDKKPLYKDYVSFLGSYKQGKKDEVCDKEDRCSPSISSSNSSASITSDLNDMPKKSFKEYLENYNNKKFNPVQADFKKNPNPNVEGKMVKTEVFIDINNDIDSTRLISKTIDLNMEPHKEYCEQKSGIDISSNVSDEKIIQDSQEIVNTPVFQFKTSSELGQRQIVVDEISQRKIENNITSNEIIKKHPLKKTSSITEKSKIFEKISTKNTAKCRVEVVVGGPSPTRNGSLPPKPVLHKGMSPEPQKTTLIKPKLAKKNSVDLSTALASNYQENNISQSEIVSPEKSTTGSPLFATVISSSTPPQKTISCGVPPPPPPPPANNFPPKKLSISPKPNFNLKGQPIYNTMPKLQNTRQVDTVDGCPPPALDKHDPRVKKMVYGALREMYGSYHDKANDYLATLPKNRVKKNNGLDSIINSIAQSSQLPGTGLKFGPSPPLSSIGRTPVTHLKRGVSNGIMDPPQCVQNAMMTKDKKPFTYTPGGIDLSEVRSPRMARRIEQNAHLAGAGDIPKQRPPQPQNYDSLPPSTLAAMRPQPQVQVFPSGPAPPSPMRGGVPPPPPPSSNAVPPPPPPPSGPLPTQKVQAGDQVLDRPDMTKIIPDNPMALLRKTGGPQPRKTLVDEMFAQQGTHASGPRSPPTPPQKSPSVEPQNGYQSSFNGREAPISPVLQQQKYQPPHQPELPTAQHHQRDQYQYQPDAPQYNPHPQNSQFRTQPPQQSTPQLKNEPSKYQPPVIERQSTKPRQNEIQPEIKTSTAHLGSLYIPPADQQQQQRRVVSPPSPPVRNQNQDSPNIQSPSLKESPKPWQIKKTQQEEIPPWAKRENQEAATSSSPSVPKQQQQWQQPEPVHRTPAAQQQPIGVRIEIRTNPPVSPYQDPEERKPNAVYITQPLVFQDPGPRGTSQQQKKADSQGSRIIPIRVEGAQRGPGTPPTPSSERSFSRQQSFGNNPTQSNKFKIIQKITNTDEDEDDEDTPITKHSPRYPQNFQQPEQMGKMKMNDADQNMATKFKQVPRDSQQPSNKGPQVRTIPIQIEGDYKPQEYVHPSEQTVPEPKKYTGSSIPSRSFKILQAMTAPDNCANVNDRNEAFPYDEGSYYPQYPPPPLHPYWPNYYYSPLHPDNHSELSEEESSTRSTPTNVPTSGSVQKQAPMPFWGYAQPPHYPTYKNYSVEGECDIETSSNPRTPLPFWPYGYQQTPSFDQREYVKTSEESTKLPQYPPYFDPYYYYYCHGYIPMYAPYPYYQMSDSDVDCTEYSSAETGQKSNPNNTHPEKNSSTTVTNLEIDNEKGEQRIDVSDSESDSECNKVPVQKTSTSGLKSVRSVNDINIYNTPEADSDEDVQYDVSSGDSGEDSDEESSSSIVENDILPHELSVILEVSEGRTESRIRSVSVMSESTTIADPSDDEHEEHTSHVRLPIKFCISVGEENTKNVLVENGNLKTFNDDEMFASFTLKSPSLTPRKRSPCRDYIEEEHLAHPKELYNDEEKTEDKTEEKCKEVLKEISEELDDGKESDESEDWWGILGKEDDQPKSRTQCAPKEDKVEESKQFDNKTNPSEDDRDKNNYASAHSSSDGESIPQMKEEAESPCVPTISNFDEPKVDHFKEISNEVVKKNEYYCEEINSVTKSRSENEMNVENKIESEKNSENSSIYNNVEGSEIDNSGKLMEMVNFVDQLKKIQETCGLWNTRTLTDTREKQLCREIINEGSIACDDNYVNKNNSMKKPTGTDCQNNIIKTEDLRKNILEYKSTKECSANYTEYNSSTSAQLFGTEKNTPNTTVSKESYDKALSRHSADDSDSDDSSEESEYSSEDSEYRSKNNPKYNDLNNNEETEVKIPSIKERIQALKDSIKQKQERIQEQKTEIFYKEKVCSHETTAHSRTKSVSTKSSMKSFEELSEEEEVDSGVTSDMSRHISDTEEFSELRKLTRYQRAATHSRLFKLLQEECENEDSDGEDEKTNTNSNTYQDVSINEQQRRDHLKLPLNNDFQSEINLESDNVSPVNERLVGELVQSFLKRKKAQVFRNMPPEKLFAAATKILQEEFEASETPTSSNSFLSPLRGSTGYSTAAHTPQEFGSNYEEYRQYYESWNDAEISHDENYDIIPSKAFKLLQEHSSYNKTGAIAGLLAKCPRVVSSKNVHKKLIKLLESSENSITVLDKPPPNSNEVTNAS